MCFQCTSVLSRCGGYIECEVRLHYVLRVLNENQTDFSTGTSPLTPQHGLRHNLKFIGTTMATMIKGVLPLTQHTYAASCNIQRLNPHPASRACVTTAMIPTSLPSDHAAASSLRRLSRYFVTSFDLCSGIAAATSS